jgi:transposase-like protein
MKKSDVIKFFGSQSATARAMRINRVSVHKWRDELSESLQYRIEIVTGGLLKSDETERLERIRCARLEGTGAPQ